jgi:hypothetical protein
MDIFKALNMSYMLIILNVIKIQRCWKKYRYKKLPNITKLIMKRQLNHRVSVENHVKKRIPGFDPDYNFGDVEVRIIEDTMM